jgi:hypothetical protein
VNPGLRRAVLAVGLGETVVVAVALVLIVSVSATAGLVVLGAGVVASSLAVGLAIRRAARAR